MNSRLLLPALILLASHAAAPAQSITNIRPVQRPGTNLVDIDYDITGTTAPLHISLQVSTDDGTTYTIPATSVSGAAGYNITPATNLRLTWDAGKDWGGRFSNTIRYKILADDNPPPEGFVRIPAGSFVMGDHSNPLVGEADEIPVHTVNVSEFFMAKFEVTKALWDEVRAWGLNNGYTDLSAGDGKAANHPVHRISWYDMVKWCNARSEKEGLNPCFTVSGAIMRTGTDTPECNWTTDGYRLPTEAEWEKAARGGSVGKNFPWGTNTISHSQANYRVYSSNGTTNYFIYDVTPRPPGSVTDYYYPSYAVGDYPYSSPVGSFAPNGYGLYDVAGNAWEWCWDWYGSYSAGAQTDPRGPSSGSYRVFRGGCWYDYARDCRVASRKPYPPTDSFSNSRGFRPARSSVP